MILFDTHAHFEGPALEAVLSRARAAGVGYVMAVGGSESLNKGALAARTAAENAAGWETPKMFTALGWDRDQAMRSDLPALDYSGASAVGEIGLDYHYGADTRKAQTELFASQLEKARNLGLPVIIHTREADDDTLAILRSVPVRGVIHSFTGSAGFCRKLLDLGFYISMSGIVTFRLADNVRESAKTIPLDRLLIETDSPYLAPVPMRGRDNEPAFVAHTAAFLSSLLGVPIEELAARTTANGLDLFSP